MTFNARQDRRYIRATYRSNRFVLVDITAPPARHDRPRPPVNLAFVVDRSGSMSGAKLHLAKLAVEQSIARLRSDDRFAIVVYDNEVEVVFESAPATPDARRTALSRLSEIQARGSTDLGAGWLRGCEQVALRLSEEGVNRCLLLTDGLANVGITDHDVLARHAAELRTRGVSTTTFGLGRDFDAGLLQVMADAGGGSYYFIPDPEAIADYVTSEVGEALEMVARDVTLNVKAGAGVTVESLTPYPTDVHDGRTTVRLGSLVADQELQVVLRLNFPFGEVGHEMGVRLELSDRDGALPGVEQRLAWEYADGRANDLQPRDRDVDRAVARMFAARARQEATRLNRDGDYSAAGAALAGVAARIRSYAAHDAELAALVVQLELDLTRLSAPMPEMVRKQMHSASYNSARTRSAQGQALKAQR